MSHAEIRESHGAAREMHTTQDALEGEDDDSRQLLDLLRNYTQIPGNTMSRRVSALHRNFDRRSILLSKTQLSSAFKLRGIQIWLGVLGLASLVSSINSAANSSTSQLLANRGDYSLTRATSTSVRFETDSLDATDMTDLDASASYSFGLMLNGCKLNTSAATVSFEGAAQVLSLGSEPIEYNGIWVSRSAAACAVPFPLTSLSSLTFRVSGSLGGGGYNPVAISGKCGWQLELALPQVEQARSAKMSDLPRIALPDECGEVLHFDYTRPLCRLPRLGESFSRVILALSFLWVGVSPYLFHMNARVGTLSLLIFASAIRLLVSLATWSLFWADFLTTVTSIFYFGSMLVSESLAAEGAVLYGLSQVVWLTIYIRELNPTSATTQGDGSMAWVRLCASLVALIVGAYCCMASRLIIMQEIKNVEQDTLVMSQAWLAFKQRTGNCEVIRDIELLASQVDIAMTSGATAEGFLFPRHRLAAVLLATRSPELRRTHYRKAALSDTNQAITSIDQLLFQALHIRPLFRRKVELWAGTCNGLFVATLSPLVASPEGGNSLLVRVGQELEEGMSIEWPTKSIARSLAKVHERYDGDVSRLCDLVRQRLVFESIHDQLKCLSTLCADEHVLVLAVKHNQHWQASMDYTGCKMISAKFVMTSDAAVARGVAGHVCELQLIIKDMYALWTPDRNRRYQAYSLSQHFYKFRWQKSSFGVSRGERVMPVRDQHTNQRIVEEGRVEEGDASTVSTHMGLQQAVAVDIDLVGCLIGVHDEARRRASRLHTAQVLRMKCSFAGDVLEQALGEGRGAYKAANWASLLFSTTPITGAFSKKPITMFLCMCGLAALQIVFGPQGHMYALINRNVFTASHFRLNVWQLRDTPLDHLTVLGGLGVTRGFSDFHVTLDDCMVEKNSVSEVHANGTSLYLSIPGQRVRANGFVIRTLDEAGSEARDAVGFDLSYCSDEHAVEAESCGKWRVVGSSDCRWHLFGMTCYPVPNWTFDTSLARGHAHLFDLRGPWFHAMGNVLRSILSAAGSLCAAVCAGIGRLHAARFSLGFFSFFLNGVVNGICVGGAHFFGATPAVGILPFYSGLVLSMFGLIIIFCERHAFRFLLFCWLTMTIVHVEDGFNVFGGAAFHAYTFKKFAWLELMSLFGWWSLVEVFCALTYRRAWLDVQADMHKYHIDWHKLCEVEMDDLRELGRLVGSITKALPKHDVCQTCRRVTPAHKTPTIRNPHSLLTTDMSVGGTCDSRNVFGTAGEDGAAPRKEGIWAWGQKAFKVPEKVFQAPEVERIVSIDQLYLQASLMQPIFIAKVCEWALASSAYFPHKSVADGFIAWLDASRDASLAANIKWANTKRPGRSFEKVYRSYGNDVSRLVDVVRQQIVFKTVRHVLDCLSTIASDPQAVICRVKNRLAIDYDAQKSAGYRDVLLDVSIVSEYTQQLGTDRHVCEVQLVLEQFQLLKTADGHHRYVEYRNKRAE